MKESEFIQLLKKQFPAYNKGWDYPFEVSFTLQLTERLVSIYRPEGERAYRYSITVFDKPIIDTLNFEEFKDALFIELLRLIPNPA